MDSSFNPYLKWLGIPLKDQPPHHYRLLGVELFEGDAEVIERAADRQMTYIRSLQTGEHAAAAQNLLNEFAAAKICLLNSQTKQQYDASLRKTTQEVALRSPLAQPAMGSGIMVAEALSPEVDGIEVVDEDIVEDDIVSADVVSAEIVSSPPPRAQSSDSNIAAASGVRLQTAQPLPDALPPAKAPQAKPPAAGGKPSPASGAAIAPARRDQGGLSLPWILAGIGAIAATLLLGGLTIWYFTSGDDPVDNVAQVDPGDSRSNATGTSGETNSGTQNTGGNSASNQNNNNSGNNQSNTGGQQSNTGQGTNGNGHGNGNGGTTGTTTNISTPAGADLLIEAPYLVGTVSTGNQVLSDRTYNFAQIDTELDGLKFTRWQYGPVPSFSLEPEREGTVYLILPPHGYRRDAPAIEIDGWEQTDLICKVRVTGGYVRNCQVLKRDISSDPVAVPLTSTMWPIVAAASIQKKARTFTDIVNNDNGNTNPVDPIVPGTNPPDEREPTDPSDPPAEAPEVVAKLAVPSSEDQAPIRTRVAEVFELASLREPAEKSTAAKRLLEVGRDSGDNATERYVILATSARLAAESGDLLTALRATELIGDNYEAPTAAMKLYLVRQFAKSRVPKQQKVEQLTYVPAVLDEGLAGDEFDAVEDTVNDLYSNGLSHKVFAERRKAARAMKEDYRAVAKAKGTLKTNPKDGNANHVVGQYVSFMKMNWEEGLPLLALSDDEQTRKIALLDIARPDSAAEQLTVGDGWFAQVESQDSDQAKGALLTRAEDWYRQAATTAKGLEAAHAKKRLDDIQQQLADLGWIDVPKKAVISAASGYGCEIYLNGEEIIDASYGRVGTATVTLTRGDIIMVQARRRTYGSYTNGFACVIAFEGSTKPEITGTSKQWTAFTTNNHGYWYKPENIASTGTYVISPSAGHTALNQMTGAAPRSLWHTGSDQYQAFFLYRVN